MSRVLTISGRLQDRHLKQLVRISRDSTVGPTALYYAGVTAPVVSASVALLARRLMIELGLTPFWQLMASAQLAALAGIAWYLIFMRWSYRHRSGRGTERSLETVVAASEAGLSVRRGPVETRIGWEGVRRTIRGTDHLAIFIDGADALIIPDDWFGGDKAASLAFTEFVTSKVPPNGS
jgi:hypothetical protein